MPISGFFSCSPNNRVDSQIDILIDRLCTERDRAGRVSFLTPTAEKIKKCAAGYTNFNLIHRISEFVKSVFGYSDWQLARDALRSSLVGRNFTLFSNDVVLATADKILGSLAKANEQNVFVSAILSYDAALRNMNDELIGIGPDRFELGQYEFNVVRAPARNFSNPRLLFN